MKKYLKDSQGKKIYDRNGFNRWSKDNGKTVYGSSYKWGVGTREFTKKGGTFR